MATGAGIRYLAIALRRTRPKAMVSRTSVRGWPRAEPGGSAGRVAFRGLDSSMPRSRGPWSDGAPTAHPEEGWRLPGARTADGAPLPGAPSHGHVPPGYQACTFSAVVGRRWSAPL